MTPLQLFDAFVEATRLSLEAINNDPMNSTLIMKRVAHVASTEKAIRDALESNDKLFKWTPATSVTFPDSEMLQELRIYHPSGKAQTLKGTLEQ